VSTFNQGPYAPAPPPAPQPEQGGWNLKVAILFGAVIALLAANIYLFVQLDRVRGDLSKFRESTLTELTNLRENTSVTTATNRKNLETLKEELEAARRQASMAVGQAKTEALSRAEQINKQLAEEQKRQQAVQAKMQNQISEVKDAATDAHTKIGEVKSDVTTVKTDVASTKAELDKTIADLKRMTGDMGEMSGLIATNGKELSALKALGDRNYFEFDLKKTKAPQKIGDIAVMLKKVDQKKNRYTVDVVADDKTVEKKDKNINEPVQFYVAKARQPYELVVNRVGKDQIVGYLATPKVQQAR
jgi:chromosome segregation ATPase